MPLDTEEENEMDYWGNQHPKCPWCDEDYEIESCEDYELYEDGEHEIDCPSCDKPFKVDTSVTFTYSTDEQ